MKYINVPHKGCLTQMIAKQFTCARINAVFIILRLDGLHVGKYNIV